MLQLFFSQKYFSSNRYHLKTTTTTTTTTATTTKNNNKQSISTTRQQNNNNNNNKQQATSNNSIIGTMFFSHHLILVWTSALLLSASIGRASADTMLRGGEALEDSKAMQEAEHEFMLLPPESEDAFILPEPDYANLTSMEIDFAPEDRNSTDANGPQNRKLASYSSLELQMAQFVIYERTRPWSSALVLVS
jgi:hypothetical protein